MPLRFPLALLLATCSMMGQGVLAQEARDVAQQSAARSFQIINAVHADAGGQDGAIRRCRAYMDEAASADKLGAKDMAVRNWDRAARGCRADALSACRDRKSAAAEQCEGIIRQSSK